MSAFFDVLRGISELLLGPAHFMLNRRDHPSRDGLAEFLEALVGKYADEGVHLTADPLILMLQDSSLTARTLDYDSSSVTSPSPAPSDVERVVHRLGWAFKIQRGASGDVERLTQILDTELRDRLLTAD